MACDKSKIQQVIFNLLKNASQAMEGSAANDPPCIVLRLYQDRDNVCLELADNGPGMPEEIKDRIFNPFFFKTAWAAKIAGRKIFEAVNWEKIAVIQKLIIFKLFYFRCSMLKINLKECCFIPFSMDLVRFYTVLSLGLFLS